MASVFCESGLSRYNFSLAELKEELRFLTAASVIRPRLGSILDWNNLDSDGKELSQDFMNSKRPDSSPAYLGMAVVISGAFENLVRNIAESAIVAINSKISEFDSLPIVLRGQNTHNTGRALAILRDPPDHIVIDAEKLAKSLATCVAGSKKYQLNAEVFSMFVKNLTPSHLTDVLGSVGITMDWDYFGRNKDYEGLCDSSGTRNTANAIVERLERFIKIRNRIAHTGDAGITVDYTELQTMLKFFMLFGGDLVKFAQLRLDKM